ncbi:unnamed protein product [Psylliodes chrysocephalus]|uniref:MADF domain-containing protein n=1 Tax=Psylliodes chrysocephalus TaxID=3402493 RepID=A0A9P0DDL0_9CUCU|nr:unnamed protein product [Psylliodes chrysocephala]
MCILRPNTTVNEIKAKLNSLRTHFNKELARIRNAPSGSGAEAARISLWCFENLLFLQDQTVATPSDSNLKVDNECTENEIIQINNDQESMSVLEEESDPENFNSNTKTPTSSKKSTSEHNIVANSC